MKVPRDNYVWLVIICIFVILALIVGGVLMVAKNRENMADDTRQQIRTSFDQQDGILLNADKIEPLDATTAWAWFKYGSCEVRLPLVRRPATDPKRPNAWDIGFKQNHNSQEKYEYVAPDTMLNMVGKPECVGTIS